MRRNHFLLVSMLVACGGDDGIRDDATCGLAVTTTGGVSAEVSGDREPACLTSPSSGDGTNGGMILIDDPSELQSVEVTVREIERGVTGTFPADVRLHTETIDWSVNDCTATVVEHSEQEPAELGTYYRVRGSVLCGEPAENAGGTAPPVTIVSLDWVYTVSWL